MAIFCADESGHDMSGDLELIFNFNLEFLDNNPLGQSRSNSGSERSIISFPKARDGEAVRQQERGRSFILFF